MQFTLYKISSKHNSQVSCQFFLYFSRPRSLSPQTKAESEPFPTDYHSNTVPSQSQQSKAKKTEEELKEEEDMQLALALSQSEAEAKEKEKEKKRMTSEIINNASTIKKTPTVIVSLH